MLPVRFGSGGLARALAPITLGVIAAIPAGLAVAIAYALSGGGSPY